MAARAIGSGTVTFGLVNIPVKLYTTGQPQSGISFNLLHKTCKSRLRQQYVCPKDEVVVDRGDMVKGYEFAKGQYVTFTEEELEQLEQQASEAIEITEFLPLSAVDPVYYEKAYYLGPDKGADKAYGLLTQALRETDRAAVATYAARGKQYLVLIRAVEKGLVMQQLRYADEVKSIDEVPIGEARVKEGELKLAKELIERGATDAFHPDQYRDEVKDRVQAQIQKKVEGEEITAPPAEAPRAQVIDLMEALKASLAGGAKKGQRRAAAETAPEKPAAKPAAKRARGGRR